MKIESAPARLRTLPSWLLNQAALAAQRRVADALGAVGADSQAELGRRCGIDRSDMVALVNELAAEGLVDRQPDDRDRRRNVVTITTAGRRRLRTLEAAVGRAQDELVSALSAKERAQLVALLTRVVEDQGPT